jgi:hypothetical protein
MRTSDVTVDGRFPRCGTRVSRDLAGRGFVRHLEHGDDCDDDVFGLGERDEPPPPDDG